MNGDFIENRENGAGIKKAEIGAERQLSPTLCCALRTALNLPYSNKFAQKSRRSGA